MMELFEAIGTRASAARLSEPGPSPEQLETLIAAAVIRRSCGRGDQGFQLFRAGARLAEARR